jgi:glycosyltransferase involved in cell wall biosynthesis
MLAAAARASRDRGLRTTLCFTDVARGRPWLDELEGLGSLCFITPGGLGSDVQRLWRVADEPHGVPTVVHSHFGGFDLASGLLGLTRRRTAAVAHAHSGNPRPIRVRSRVYGAVAGRMLDATICVSRDIYADARARAFPADHLIYMPNAIDTDRFSLISAAERREARRALGVSPDAKVVLHFGWDWTLKGGDRFLATAQFMAQRADTVFMTVVGESASAPLAKLSAAANVMAVPPRESVNELYAAADVYLNCSRSEGMPYAILEALARGLPVVATALPVAHEVLDGVPAARIVSADPAHIARGLEDMLAPDDAARGDLAAAARAHVEAGYALGPWADALVDRYLGWLGGKQ